MSSEPNTIIHVYDNDDDASNRTADNGVLEEARCPKCGADLTRPGAVRVSTDGWYNYDRARVVAEEIEDGRDSLPVQAEAASLDLSHFTEFDSAYCQECCEELFVRTASDATIGNLPFVGGVLFQGPASLAAALGVTCQAISMRMKRGTLVPDAWVEHPNSEPTPIWTEESVRNIVESANGGAK